MLHKREVLLNNLQMASMALTPFETLEQSNCFIFDGDKLITFNGDLRVVVPFNIGLSPAFAVYGIGMRRLVESIGGEDIDLTLSKSSLVLQGGKRRGSLPIQQEITLPYKDVPKPDKMQELNKGVQEAVSLASRTCGVDHSKPGFTHIHIHPKGVEATDGFRAYQYAMDTGMPDVLLASEAVIPTRQHTFEKVGLSESWVHALLPAGVRVSMRRGMFDYFSPEQMGKLMSIQGEQIKLPKVLADVLERMADFGGGARGEAAVQIGVGNKSLELKVITSFGGDYEETVRAQYKGNPFTSRLNLEFGSQSRKSRTPDLLKDVLRKNQIATITPTRMLIEHEGHKFIFSLEEVEG